MNKTSASKVRALTVLSAFATLFFVGVTPAEAVEDPGPACDLLSPEPSTVCIWGNLLGFVYNSNGIDCDQAVLTPIPTVQENPGQPHSEVTCGHTFCSFAEITIKGLGGVGVVQGVAECGALTAECTISRPTIRECTDSNAGDSVGLRTCKTVVAGVDKQYTYKCRFF